MAETILEKLFEHNNWANDQIIQHCASLSEAQLDADPESATRGSIRLTLWHLVDAQQGYLSILTGVPARFHWEAPPAFDELQEAALVSGEGLLDLTREKSSPSLKNRIQTSDGYLVERWVVMVQAINHATEHREQLKSMLSALGVSPPNVDGWTFGEVTDALTRISK